MKKAVKLIEGYHLTATEKRCIREMLEAGYETARNRPNTKTYAIMDRLGNDRFRVKIGTKAVWTIGDIPKWQYSTVIVEYKGRVKLKN